MTSSTTLFAAYIENVPQGTVPYLQEGSGFRDAVKVLETYFIYLFIFFYFLAMIYEQRSEIFGRYACFTKAVNTILSGLSSHQI